MPGESGTLELELTGGTTVRARAGIAANGVHYRRLEAPGVDELIGAGVHYGSSPSEAALCRNCDVADADRRSKSSRRSGESTLAAVTENDSKS